MAKTKRKAERAKATAKSGSTGFEQYGLVGLPIMSGNDWSKANLPALMPREHIRRILRYGG